MSSANKTATLQIANIVAFLATIIVNTLANTFALNGKTTGEISDLYPTLVTPAGYVFSIWGVIYALLFIFIIFQALPNNRDKPFIQKINLLFILSNLLNITWLFLWHYDQITLSVIPMFALLATLIAIYLRLQIGRSDASLKEKLSVHLPFSVYLGWITIASIANVATVLVANNWDGMGMESTSWAVLVIAVALIITLAVVATRRDVAYGLVIVWALTGIIVKQGENQNIVMTSEISILIIVLALAVTILISKVKSKSRSSSP